MSNKKIRINSFEKQSCASPVSLSLFLSLFFSLFISCLTMDSRSQETKLRNEIQYLTRESQLTCR